MYTNRILIILFGILFILPRTIAAQENVLAAPTEEESLIQITSAEPIELSMNDAGKIALLKGYDIQIARIDRDIQATTVLESQAIYDTFLSIRADYSNDTEDQPSIVFGNKQVDGNLNFSIDKKIPLGTEIGIDFLNHRQSTSSSFVALNPNFDTTGRIRIKQPLLKNFMGMIDRGLIRIVKLDLSQFNNTTKAQMEDTVFKTREAYWNVVLAGQRLRARRRAMDTANDFYEITKSKLKTGLSEEPDVLAAEANLRIRRSELLIAHAEFKNEKNYLKFLLQIPFDRDIAIQDIEERDLNQSFPQAVKRAFEQRWDYQNAIIEMKKKNIQLRMSKNNLFPTLDLEGSYAINGLDAKPLDAPGKIFSFNNPTYQAGVTLSMPLELSEARATFQRAKLEKEKAITSFKKLEDQIVVEIDRAFRSVKVAHQTWAEAKAIALLQDEKLTAEKKRFLTGRSSSSRMIDFQEDVIEADLALVQSEANYHHALDSLYRFQNALLYQIDPELKESNA